MQTAVEGADAVFHLAAQVAVTTSVTDPREDFEINALGTFNVLEAVRRSASQPVLPTVRPTRSTGKWPIWASSSADWPLRLRPGERGHLRGALDPILPYGCSKCAGDQYVLDYARIYGLKTVVFRESCICGPRQFGDGRSALAGVVLHSRLPAEARPADFSAMASRYGIFSMSRAW